ncbi:outer membrane protein OmpK [Parashewanella tropica]|uniref:nucleoside-specific channel-forming Tsx family protein n=1 Tax=Parashewanella tropica TaxID=2547970 RepID=UPI001059EC9E|nr:outer membrane protein OmpK [Parashewanella tropica]
MKKVKSFALAAVGLAALSGNAFAADRTDVHATDYKWMQANLMYAFGEKPQNLKGGDEHNYLELEFGGRAGVMDYYGYLDVFNLTNRSTSKTDKGPGKSKMFLKFNPRFSLDAITGKDLSFGPVKEVYFSTLFNFGGGAIKGKAADGKTYDGDVNMSFWGLGADVMVPWLGKTGMNLYATYDINAKDWNGYQFSANWFKPFIFFSNKSFISFQGYVDYQFAATDKGNEFVPKVSNGGTAFLGFYWHSDRYSVGYGLKSYKNIYTIKNGGGKVGLRSTGLTHFLAATYKF